MLGRAQRPSPARRTAPRDRVDPGEAGDRLPAVPTRNNNGAELGALVENLVMLARARKVLRIAKRLWLLRQQVSDGIEQEKRWPPFAKNASANSRPMGLSAAAETIRMGTPGFSFFISRAISVPVLPPRKWPEITNSMGFCLRSSSPSSPELAVSTF